MNATSFCVWVTRTPTCHSGLYPGGLHATDNGEISSFGPAPERRQHLRAASKRQGLLSGPDCSPEQVSGPLERVGDRLGCEAGRFALAMRARESAQRRNAGE